MQITLYGETETIEVWVEGFAVVSDGEAKKFILQQAQSNKPWLTNIFAHIIGREWKIPEIPQFKAYIELAAELLKAESPEQEDI